MKLPDRCFYQHIRRCHVGRCRRRALKGWRQRIRKEQALKGRFKTTRPFIWRQYPFPGTIVLLLAAAIAIWGRFTGRGFNLSLKDLAGVDFIEERRLDTGTGNDGTGKPSLKTGVNIHLEDGAISIFKVDEYREAGSD